VSDAIVLGWVVLCLVMLVHRRFRSERLAERAPGTWLGIIVQALGFSAIWTLRRAAVASQSGLWVSVAADAFGVGAIALGIAAIWTLGRQWSVAGRVLPDHTLIRHGPYAYLRHPIYTAMFGMLLATGVSMSSWLGIAAGTALFVAGTTIRVHFEEKLLRQRFGVAYEEYAANVPAFLPTLAAGGRRTSGCS
jgi:protein-S-isoprenylcysteine O-methyltransferase Ste14